MKALLEKMISRDAVALSDAELLSLVMGDDSDMEPDLAVAERMLAAYEGSLAALGRDDIARLRMAGGAGLKRAGRIVAAAELGRRIMASQASEADAVFTSDDVIGLFRPSMEKLKYEECWVLYLTSSNNIIEKWRVSSGGIQATTVDHRLVIKRALELLATQIILVHNHPSGTAEPSHSDKVLTEKIGAAAALFDIRLLDHVIIALSSDYSFRNAGLLR